MNNPHKNARMTPLGRAEMVRRIREEGRPLAAVAAGFGISEKTARKWLRRYDKEGPEEGNKTFPAGRDTHGR